MSNNHLIPTPIVDKNGKHTTVHKKLDIPSASSGRSVRAVPPKKPVPAPEPAIDKRGFYPDGTHSKTGKPWDFDGTLVDGRKVEDMFGEPEYGFISIWVDKKNSSFKLLVYRQDLDGWWDSLTDPESTAADCVAINEEDPYEHWVLDYNEVVFDWDNTELTFTDKIDKSIESYLAEVKAGYSNTWEQIADDNGWDKDSLTGVEIVFLNDEWKDYQPRAESCIDWDEMSTIMDLVEERVEKLLPVPLSEIQAMVDRGFTLDEAKDYARSIDPDVYSALNGGDY